MEDLFFCMSPFLRSSHYIGSSETRTMAHKRNVLIFLYHFLTRGIYFQHTFLLSLLQLIVFFSVRWLTKYYLLYLATLISPPWSQVLMTWVTELQSASPRLQHCLSGWLSCHILTYHTWASAEAQTSLLGPKNININLNEALLIELSLSHDHN